MKITFNHGYGVEDNRIVTIEEEQAEHIDDVLTMIIDGLVGCGFAESTVDNAIITKAEELNEDKNDIRILNNYLEN